ncbi:hypothetical protein FT663_01925 [Candidozyma haemuli var. vulneris]|uniref:Major facilitator superfamily (MFS) profile domain-containing protein n=1 Tax=Candidozyma haemuli TaxID=45357 RepID=A0A2V1AUE6_9ASCO|nr:hypothetical protein CXQ85_000416 [[Candida] haemuloni]KAF3989777.1 hypothetical protein FT662_02652 [[Candida] haemuloni var. vulneris]KAF3993335.1 hypothetical protein FT663_01925 [[Candida] haemuloni var. vulneris]PVH21439.1 hypothetical protein CXQ85_000416 [[Candida] haemuloni]
MSLKDKSGVLVEEASAGSDNERKDYSNASLASVEDDPEKEDFSDIDEKKLLRKLDFRLIPLFTVLYLLSFLDRGNIGNAKIEGLPEDLNLVGNQFNMALLIFFIFYAVLEMPSNMILHRTKPHIYIPTTMVIWSIVMTLMGTVQNYDQLLATRALLGIFEAPLFPGISYLLSMYYSKKEILVRQAVFFSAATLAGAFSGLLAAAIAQMDGVGGYEGWRWIFIIEGLLTFVVGVFSYTCFPSYPKDCKFLTPKERRFVIHKVKYSTNAEPKKTDGEEMPQDINRAEDDSRDRKYLWAVLKDWQVWLQLLALYGVNVPLYAVSLFGPTIIHSLGYSTTESQLLGVPPYVLATSMCVLQSWLSARWGVRAPFLIFNILCICVGFAMCLGADAVSTPGVVYGGMYAISSGCAAYPLVVIWLSNNLSGSYKRALGMGLQIGLGNLSGVFASNFYRTQDAPQYKLGHGLGCGFAGMGLIVTVIIAVSYLGINKKRKHDIAQGKYDDVPPEDLIKMGDRNPYFLYRL